MEVRACAVPPVLCTPPKGREHAVHGPPVCVLAESRPRHAQARSILSASGAWSKILGCSIHPRLCHGEGWSFRALVDAVALAGDFLSHGVSTDPWAAP